MKIAVIAHLFYQDLIEELIYYFKNLPKDVYFYVSTSQNLKKEIQDRLDEDFGKSHVHVRAVENRGMDIAPFLLFYKEIYADYDLICKVHTKRGAHTKFLKGWRTYLLENLIGSRLIVEKIISCFEHDEMLGLIFPEHFPFIRNYIEWGKNYDMASKLLNQIGIQNINKEIDFPSASMFWFRPKALILLNDLNLQVADFEGEEEYAIDGMLSNAVERVLLYIVEARGFFWKTVLFQPYFKKKYETVIFAEIVKEHQGIVNENIFYLSELLRENAKALERVEKDLRSSEERLMQYQDHICIRVIRKYKLMVRKIRPGY